MSTMREKEMEQIQRTKRNFSYSLIIYDLSGEVTTFTAVTDEWISLKFIVQK
jgi:hypothetical protein